MVVMKRYIFVFGCLFLNVCQAMENNAPDIKELSSLRSIEKDDLPKLIGKYVLYKGQDSVCRKGVLGRQVFQSTFYRVYPDGNNQNFGIACPVESLYYAEDELKK